ncbi:hypothetical protein Pla175_38960 [Pirellulimonas nuda]|uniref:Uncharacterized protein n=1 Tax=Pirellulimonas nuda TaxID=2528009 RepID=A0A518DG89_9BACT|nr:hypothetical protein Pla175_38960 [Pirellulimonas nuda]
MDEVLLLINQTAEATRQECDRFLAEPAASRSEWGETALKSLNAARRGGSVRVARTPQRV